MKDTERLTVTYHFVSFRPSLVPVNDPHDPPASETQVQQDTEQKKKEEAEACAELLSSRQMVSRGLFPFLGKHDLRGFPR